MPPLARRYLRTAIAFAILGVMTGMHMSSALHLKAGEMHRYYLSAHAHVMLVGFSLMVAMSVALWKLPEAPAGSRYRPSLMRLAYWLTSVGTLLRYLSESWIGYQTPEPESVHRFIYAAGMVQGTGILIFLVNLLPRIRGPRD